MFPTLFPPAGRIRVLLAIVIVSVIFPHALQAQVQVDATRASEQMLVTADRQREPVDDALASVTVISREDIQRLQVRDISELMRLQAGVDAVRTGPRGSQTSLFLRGANSNHVLVLIDGVRAASSATGSFAWEHLPVDQIERIEIVRGPRAALWGSDALGGVIQIFTRQPESLGISLGAGSFGSYEARAAVGQRSGEFHAGVSAGYSSSGGFSAQNPNGFAYSPDDDGYRSRNLSISTGGAAGAGRWQASVLATEDDVEFDQGITDHASQVAGIRYHGPLTPYWQQTLRLGYASDDLESDFGFFQSFQDSSRWDAAWQHQLDLDAVDVGFGADYYDEEGRTSGGVDDERDNLGLWLSLQGGDRFSWQFSGRHDDNSRFGSETTGQLALGYTISPALQTYASVGTAFRAPNFNELFSPGFGGQFAGNPELNPETSTSGELGLRWHQGAHQFGAAVFSTEFEDLIAFTGPDFQAVNVNEAEAQGLELEYGLSTGPWNLQANLTLQDTTDESTGRDLLRRPDEKLALSADYRFANDWLLGMEALWLGERLDVGGVELGSETRLSLRISLPLTDHWQLQSRLSNLTDEDLTPAFGFNGPGRAWFLGLSGHY